MEGAGQCSQISVAGYDAILTAGHALVSKHPRHPALDPDPAPCLTRNSKYPGTRARDEHGMTAAGWILLGIRQLSLSVQKLLLATRLLLRFLISI